MQMTAGTKTKDGGRGKSETSGCVQGPQRESQPITPRNHGMLGKHDKTFLQLFVI